ncbi:Monosaccharide ABC transporter membrane protein, CUT2 family [Paraburkholderia sabiae]|uniref:ABC transporter permease n=1 Tax=Paraburkholderia sabiae TaxID=273251 RepID=UPI001CB23EC4|nr:ABC transporter permease [Paraburkholderia sabiae]CAG9194195.1 Monosaccharide ABC transporter membrane protein, CUT2 family [Paraburkholderia sabiae]
MLKTNERALDATPNAQQLRRQQRLRAWLTNVKYYLGLIVLLALGALTSPHAADGSNIFLSSANFSDVFRQVANVGVMSVGMTLVIITAGIDLSVGSVMGFGSVLTAILLTTPGSNAASWTALALDAISLFAVVYMASGMFARRGRGGAHTMQMSPGLRDSGHRGVRMAVAGIVALLACVFAWHQLPQKVSLLTVLWMVPLAGLAIGALNGFIITRGRMQPFIVTLAAMVGVMGMARLVAGQDTAVYSIYSGSNATTDIDNLRALLFGVVPVPALFFIVIALIADFVLNRTVFGKYLYAIGGNEKCARISGLKVDRHKIAAYAISGMLAALVGVLYAAQYRQGKADAGVGWELDAIAAVVIGGTSLMGGVGRIAGTVAGVLIFGFLGNILLLNNIDSNTQLVLKGLIIVVAVFLQQTRMNPQTMLARVRGRRSLP